MESREHWEAVYQAKAADQVSWYRPHLEQSLAWIAQSGVDRAAAIIDVGGGEATLVDDLLAQDFLDITVLDISSAALAVARERLGGRGGRVHWLAVDITQATLPPARYDLWHDRAVFHFLVRPAQRAAYLQRLTRALRPGGEVIMATFGPQGPEKCSGLPVVRYDAAALSGVLGPDFELLATTTERHETPFGTRQQFTWCRFRFMPNGEVGRR